MCASEFQVPVYLGLQEWVEISPSLQSSEEELSLGVEGDMSTYQRLCFWLSSGLSGLFRAALHEIQVNQRNN